MAEEGERRPTATLEVVGGGWKWDVDDRTGREMMDSDPSQIAAMETKLWKGRRCRASASIRSLDYSATAA